MLYVPVASAGEATHVHKGVTGSAWDAVCHWLMNPLGACVMGSMEDRESWEVRYAHATLKAVPQSFAFFGGSWESVAASACQICTGICCFS